MRDHMHADADYTARRIRREEERESEASPPPSSSFLFLFVGGRDVYLLPLPALAVPLCLPVSSRRKRCFERSSRNLDVFEDNSPASYFICSKASRCLLLEGESYCSGR